MKYAVDINKIIEVCPHYDEIISYDYDYDDNITLDLIYWYKELIFSSNLDVQYIKNQLNRLDYCIYKYITDLYYQKKISNYIIEFKIKISHNNNYELLNIIFSFTYIYDENMLYNKEKGKWIII